MSTVFYNILDQLAFDPKQPLMFSSGLFWCLFIVFLPIYALLKERRRAMMLIFVILFSLYVSYQSSGWLFVLLLLTTTVDHRLALLIARSGDGRRRKWLLWLSIACSLSILAFFKYANFVLFNWHALVGGNFQPLDLLLPLGISFYTFKSISYVVDVYKGKLTPTRSWLTYAFYLTFFPSLAAGPITRAVDFLPQIERNAPATREDAWRGLWQVLIGVVKKAVFADYLAQYTFNTFSVPGGEGVPLLVGAVAFTLQIYCDFSGYSDMAIGLGRIMGYDLGVNFDFPFRSLNVTEFWRRWHISLSTWLRDYVYIPLGGNRKGKPRQYMNLLATMLIGGLWHGANWTFVAWGGMHGVALCLHKALMPHLKRVDNTLPVTLLAGLVTFVFIVVTFIFFRAENIGEACLIIRNICCKFDPSWFITIAKQQTGVYLVMLAVIVTHYLPKRLYASAERFFVSAYWPVKLLIFLVVVQMVLEFASAEVQPFIYNQF